MKKIVLFMSLAIIFLSPSVVQASTVASIVLNQPSPHFGDSINFTEVYPQVAAKMSGRPTGNVNPTTQLTCHQGGIQVYFNDTAIASKQKVTGGWIGETGFLTLVWDSPATGPITCEAILFSTNTDGSTVVWAYLGFDVAE